MTKLDWDRMKRRDAVAQGRRDLGPQRDPVSKAQPGLLLHKTWGICPQCGSKRWWDNRARKNAGTYSSKAPDARCANPSCDYVIWPSTRR